MLVVVHVIGAHRARQTVFSVNRWSWYLRSKRVLRRSSGAYGLTLWFIVFAEFGGDLPLIRFLPK